VFGGRVLSRGNIQGAPGYIQIANTWLIVNVGGASPPRQAASFYDVAAGPPPVPSGLVP